MINVKLSATTSAPAAPTSEPFLQLTHTIVFVACSLNLKN
jgi:hypothetical protein